MPIVLTEQLMRKIYSKAPASIIAAFVAQQAKMSDILSSNQRAALCFANMSVETSGFTNPGLVENINYSAARMAEVWPNRFANAAAVVAKYGNFPGWQKKAFDDIYGNRMGNRPGTSDGSSFIGRGGCQITGRDGYTEIGKRIGVDLVNNPSSASTPDLQPAIAAAFWSWKGLSKYADAGDVTGARKAWNGGTNGLSQVKSEYSRILKVLKAVNTETAAKNVVVSQTPRDPIVVAVQEALDGFGYHEVGQIDGRMGGNTRGAITAFLGDRHITGPSEITAQVRAEIDRAKAENWMRPIAPDRAYATAADLAPKVQSIATAQRAGLGAKLTAYGALGTTIFNGAMKILPDTNDQVSPYWSLATSWIKPLADLPGWVPGLLVIGVAGYTVWQINKSKQATVEDYQTKRLN